MSLLGLLMPMKLRRTAQAIFERLGYRVRRTAASDAADVRFTNFANLASAYEHALGRAGTPVPDDPRRYPLLARLEGTPPSEAYAIVQALADTSRLPGDVCEFGVAQGETSALIAHELERAPEKTLHLFDSFRGLPPPTAKDELKDDIFKLGSMAAYAGTMANPEHLVRQRLLDVSFPASRYRIHRGFVDGTLASRTDVPNQVSFAYVDFDLYAPIQAALAYLERAAVPGARVIVDDYDFFSTGAKTAVDEFLAASPSRWTMHVPDKALGCFAVLSRLDA